MSHDIDWDDPEARFRLLEQVGVEEYNRRFKAEMAAATVAVVNGYPIRTVTSRFGRLYVVDGLGCAYSTRDQAEERAAKATRRLKPI